MTQHSGFLSFLMFLSLTVPSVALSYILYVPGLGKLTLPFGQYIFFFVVVISSLFFVLQVGLKTVSTCLRQKALYFSIFLFIAGVLISANSIWNIRLLFIVSCISISSIILAILVHHSQKLNQKLVVSMLLLPFAIPTILAFLLEFFGPFNFGFELANIKHVEYDVHRWHFLSQSANGFGLNAALTFVAAYIAFFISLDFRNKLLCTILGSVVAVSLFYSGTRAAFVFSFSAITVFHLFFHGSRYLLFFLMSSCATAVLFIGFLGVSEIADFLRLSDNLNKLSSARWQGIVGLWEIFKSSPVVGRGFGAADNGLPVYPTNILYLALPVEVGIFGFLGALGFLFLPAWLCVRQIIEKKQLAFLRNKSFLLVYSTCCLAGFVPYLFFEFNILRVSAVNQLFFFFWGYLYFTVQQEQKTHLTDNGRG